MNATAACDEHQDHVGSIQTDEGSVTQYARDHSGVAQV